MGDVVSGNSLESSTVKDDGTFIRIVPENLLIDIREQNTEYLRDNFEIEVFLVEEVTETEGVVDYVNYYFDIFVDSEVSEDILCSSIEMLKSNGHRIESEIICPESKKVARAPIYTSRISEEDTECQD